MKLLHFLQLNFPKSQMEIKGVVLFYTMHRANKAHNAITANKDDLPPERRTISLGHIDAVVVNRSRKGENKENNEFFAIMANEEN